MNGPWFSVCSVNPRIGLGHVEERLFQPAVRSKRVGVIGGGPGGMYAAMVLRDRGHQVTLYEKHEYLGGQLHHADFAGFK